MSYTAELLIGMVEGRQGRRLGYCGQVIRHAHDTHAVDDALAGREIADTCTREGEGLAHGTAHGEVFVFVDEFERGRRARIAELNIGLIHHDHRMHAFGGPDDLCGLGRLENTFQVIHR